MKFILSDESVNRHGFRVLTSGIELEAFRNNPVMFYNHNRGTLPIGKWENISISGGKLMAEALFDEDDDFALQVSNKVQKGIINMTSIGFDVLEVSDDIQLMLPGQKRSTVTKSSLLEASIADIGSNKNAIKLSFPQRGLTMSGDIDERYLNDLLPLMGNHKGGFSSGSAFKTQWTLRDWEKNDSEGLSQMLKHEPLKYMALFETEYGEVPGMLNHVLKLGREIPDVKPVVDRTSWTQRDWETRDPEAWATLMAEPGMRQVFYP
ncbi:MAG: HK97 family phage prohead protease [Bacteroidota bacterium]